MSELPRRSSQVQIADVGQESVQALEWLNQNEWKATLNKDFEIGPAERVRLWSPNRFLEEVLPNIEGKRALDIACGGGRDAVHMADHGFEVTALDHLPDALDLGRRLEKRYLVGAIHIEWVRDDLPNLSLTGKYDLITCFFFLDRDVLQQIHESLNPGGSFVFETFTSVHRETLGKPRREAFVVKPGELEQILYRFETMQHEEGWHGDRHTVRYWGRLK